jgi:hypothetical protein
MTSCLVADIRAADEDMSCLQVQAASLNADFDHWTLSKRSICFKNFLHKYANLYLTK